MIPIDRGGGAQWRTAEKRKAAAEATSARWGWAPARRPRRRRRWRRTPGRRGRRGPWIRRR
uniref:Uncharacterized protein n=1 Tax=Oryza brachyantha TaxID=4533 RepID=J3L124_ORYBR